MTAQMEKLEIQREQLAYKRELRATRQAAKVARLAERKAAHMERSARQREQWAQFTANLPLRVALLGVAGVWLLGCLWSFREQTALAAASGFETPWVLPLLIDGFAASCAGVAYAASLDGRAALAARIMTGVAVAGSASSNGLWAWERSGGQLPTVTLAVGVPVVANLAFEVLLGERRRVVKRRRGLPAPKPVEPPRLVRLVLSPLREFWAWRRRTLALTAPSALPVEARENDRPQVPGAIVVVLEALAERLRRTRETSTTPDAPGPVDNDEPPPAAAATVTSPMDQPTGKRRATAKARRLDRIVEQLEAGAELDGPKVAALVGVSARQGQRDLADAQNVMASGRPPSVTDSVTTGEQPRLVSVRSAGEGY